VHVKVALAEGGLHGAAALVKPALLYADRVTVFSPAASMVKSAQDLASLTDAREQAAVALQLIEGVPEFLSQLDVDPDTLSQLRTMLTLDPQLVRGIARIVGGAREVDELYKQLGEVSQVWQDQMPEAIERITESTGAGELLVAVEAGAVEVADLTSTPSSAVVARAVRSAVGQSTDTNLDDMVSGFTTRLVEMLVDPGSFPLLDGSSASLIRALEREAMVLPSDLSVRRGSEVTAATAFMGFLPCFPEMPMDEVLDLRKRLQNPLVRFRAVIGEMSREFQSRPFDLDFAREIEDAWRLRVEPALRDIREALAEHGLLREVASVAMGDPRRILAEAGAVLIAANSPIVSLSHFLGLMAAIGTPVADTAGRAILGVRAARQGVRRNAFYFLHRVAEEARRS